MAAYSALVSLTHILHQILRPPPLNKIIIDRAQTEFLLEKVNFVIHSLETCSTRRSLELADIETKIAVVAYAAEDLIESNVMQQIVENDGDKISTLLCEGIQTILEKFHSIEKDLSLIEEDTRGLRPKSLPATTSSSPPIGGKTVMVGLDKHVNEIMAALATDESNRQIIPIVGMGGVGKTTLAIAVYNNPFVVEQFHVRAWVTVSQEYTLRELLIRLLTEVNKVCPDKEDETDELGLQLHKELFDRKYLIVLDDMWHIEVWDKLRMFLPRNENGSRILVTTRLSNLADDFGSCAPYSMDFLDEGQSWDLLCKTVFADEDCPVELEEIGEDIAEKCGGLPLALVVIGGLLGKLERTREHWESVAGDVTSALNYGNDEHVMKILSLSYVHLPLYLKPCFLYLAMFPEDFEIYVTRLIKLWVAEGLIKHTQAKSLEEVAQEYLEDLISRNLILVDKRGSSGKVNRCRMHDLIRDLCTMEAEKEKFLYLAKLDNPNVSPNIETERRLSLSCTSEPVPLEGIEALQSTEYNRSLLSHCKLFGYDWWVQEGSLGDTSRKSTVNQIINGFGLLKVIHVTDQEISIDLINLRNLRYVVARSVSSFASLSLCWNIQSLEVYQEITLPAEIWQMPQLRHLKMSSITLPDPPDDHNLVVLENLQTLARVENFKCAEQVLERIPNLRKLKISYDFGSSDECEQVGNYCLENLVCFKKLESLQIDGPEKLRAGLAFPLPLKKLSLAFCKIPWDDFSIVGSLPNLEVLKLYRNATEGDEWNPIEGEFCRLKYLMICASELRIWEVENHFPVLERLVLSETKLEEIPLSLAEIITLDVIELYPRDSPLLSSAKEISDEREMLGYEPLQISIS